MTALLTSDENRADYRCQAQRDMMPDLELVRDVERGTPAIRKGGSKYLPKWPGERTTIYNQRLRNAPFFNAYKKVKNGLVGMICKTNPELGTDIDPEIKAHLENIDLAGTHIDVFVKDLLHKALEGHAFIFVDMEKPLPPGSTLYQRQQRGGMRPYWNIYTKDQAQNWLSDRINGEEVLTQITFEEHATERAGRYGEKAVLQYRTLWLPILAVDEQGYPTAYGPMQFELKRKNAKDNTETVIDKGTTKLDRLPVVPVYTNKRGFLVSDPYLLELAYLVLEHYKKWSYLDTQEKALVPILVHKEVDPPTNAKVPQDSPPVNDTKQIGPNVVFKLTGENDALEWKSHDSRGVDSARQSLLDIEQRISATSLSIIAPKDKVAVTATDKLLDQGERISELGTIARALQDGIETALGIHARMIGKADANGDGGSVKIVADASTEITPAPADPKMPGVGLPVADAAQTAAATSAVN